MSSAPDEVTDQQIAPSGPSYRKTSVLGNAVRGAMMGTVETVPGVSAGTVALVVGIYDQIIDSASHLITAVRKLITGLDRAAAFRSEMAAVHWKVVIPAVIGMLVAVLLIAGPMVNLLENYPEQMRGLFFGMVLASIAVPFLMLLDGFRYRRQLLRWAGKDPSRERLGYYHVLAAILGLIAGFWLVSLPQADLAPTPWIIILAAAVAISALVLPGLSGSFILLTFGLYEPTLRAVDERDLGYLGIFLIGLILGGIVIVKALKWLLDHHHALTLAVLTGVMAGALRSLWPWQDEAGSLLGPDPNTLMPVILLMLAGVAIVVVLIIVDRRMARRAQDS
ncbi:DUF368 domain-containing protein [Auritidibacter sp. NML130574]|uniref:DUF368 domain-containing protein n=1 Tax=Auritidibacter sp. NML130574 TaxID=2170745 RepID=UPI000D72B2FC|nr:DUF368 domain-containing protein [Auritidibacter sp. NML130574]AXR74526.1 DUF368 domain-containing protein [Auritidibacter sp. NML130574]